MELKFVILCIFVAGIVVSNANSSKILRYKDDLSEGSKCPLGNDKFGTCQKPINCKKGFKELQNANTGIPVCEFIGKQSVICCPSDLNISQEKEEVGEFKQFTNLTFEFCRDEYLQLRLTPSDYYVSVVNGKKVNPGEFTNMAVIGWSNSDETVDYQCGGTIISPRHILTAAHCASYNGRKPDVVRLGDIDLKSSEDDDFVQMKKIMKITKHPLYKNTSNYHDIAVLEVESDIEFDERVSPICLKNDLDIPSLPLLEAAGYGAIDFGDRRSDELLKISLSIVENSECNTFYKVDHSLANGIIDEQICAEGIVFDEEDSDTCSGDSGGPLQYSETISDKNDENREIPILVGLTSFGIGCASQIPGVYVNIMPYLDFIESTVNGS